jgi:hypothetical protein
MNEQRIHKHCGYTLVDITKTDVTQYTPERAKMRNKHRNWETVVQILSLRTQVLNIKQFKTVKADLSHFEFGDEYQGQHRVWSFEFTVEFENLYTVGYHNYRVLENDFAQTPIITELDETVTLSGPLFYTAGSNKNIYFKKSTD